MPTVSEPRGRLDRLAVATAAALGMAAVVAVLTAARLALRSDVAWSHLVEENEASNALLGAAFGILGAVAVADRPRSGLSWLFVAEGQTNALGVLAARWLGSPASAPGGGGGDLVAVVATYAWIPGVLLAATVLPFLFPTGRWLAPAWRWAGRSAVARSLLATAVAFTSAPPVTETFPGHRNPLAVFPWSESAAPLLGAAGFTVGFAALGLVCLVLRFRRGGRAVRAQVAWLFLALTVNLAVTPLPSRLPGLLGGALLVFALASSESGTPLPGRRDASRSMVSALPPHRSTFITAQGASRVHREPRTVPRTHPPSRRNALASPRARRCRRGLCSDGVRRPQPAAGVAAGRPLPRCGSTRGAGRAGRATWAAKRSAGRARAACAPGRNAAPTEAVGAAGAVLVVVCASVASVGAVLLMRERPLPPEGAAGRAWLAASRRSLALASTGLLALTSAHVTGSTFMSLP